MADRRVVQHAERVAEARRDVDFDEGRPPGEPGEGVGHAHGHALVQGEHELHLRIVLERVHEPLLGGAGVAEDVAYPVGHELFDHRALARHPRHQWGLPRGDGVGGILSRRRVVRAAGRRGAGSRRCKPIDRVAGDGVSFQQSLPLGVAGGPPRAARSQTMRFGIFGSAQAKRGGPDVDSGAGFREFVDLNVEAEALGLSELVRGRASLHRLRPDLGDAEPADVGRRTDLDAPPGDRGHGAALAQPGAAGRAGRHHGPAVRGTDRFRDRPGLPPQRVRRLLHSRWRSPRSASTKSAGRHDQGVDLRRSRGRTTASTGSSTTSSSSRRPRRSRTRRCGWAPVVRRRSRRWPRYGYNLLLDQFAPFEQIGERHRPLQGGGRGGGAAPSIPRASR